MNHVYILQSEKNGRFYVGSTTDLNERIKKHSGGSVLSTKAYRPWKIVFRQEFESYSDARKAEIRVKKYKRRDYIIKLISGDLVL